MLVCSVVSWSRASGLAASLVAGCSTNPTPVEAEESSSEQSTAGTDTSGTYDGTGGASDEGGFLPKSDLLSPDVGPADSHAEDMQPIWDGNCIIYCHAVGMEPAAADLDLYDDAFGSIVNEPSSQVPQMMLVSPGAPDQSYLWHKLTGTHLDVGGEGEAMPATGVSLDDETLARVEAWIAAGAPP